MKKTIVQSVFEQIKHGGITVHYWDGEEISYGDKEPKVTIIFNKEPPLSSVSQDPVLTLGEYYMDDVIDYQGDLNELLHIMEMNMMFALQPADLGKKLAVSALKGMVSVKEKLKQRHNIHDHYDLGNDFFSLWLDKTMCYSCAYFRTPQDTLYDAQLQKIDLILRKLRLQAGERLLDIGCGWGWLILRAAHQYGVHATGITLSDEQYAGTQERIAQAGLEEQVEVKLLNYLDLDSEQHRFDKVVSVGMFEHVGQDNLGQYMQKVHDLLVPGGLSMLHTITNLKETVTNAWISKYIFPGAYVPSLRETIWLLADYDFRLLHIESFRMHYALTLDRWYENFSRHLEQVEHEFGRRFVRMWTLYLTGCAACLRAGGLDIHQILFSRGPNNSLPLTWEGVYKDFNL